jgi:hypothetical protein
LSPSTPASFSGAAPNAPERRFLLSDIDVNIRCKKCGGYLREATAVTECLHAFCKSCILEHLVHSNTCPDCKGLIHQTRSFDHIMFDRTLQSIVDKIVPKFVKDEHNRDTKDQITERTDAMATTMNLPRRDDDEQVYLSLKRVSSDFDSRVPSRTYIRCSSLTTIAHLKKFIAQKLLNSAADRRKDVEVTCDNGEPLKNDNTLKLVWMQQQRHPFGLNFYVR